MSARQHQPIESTCVLSDDIHGFNFVYECILLSALDLQLLQ